MELLNDYVSVCGECGIVRKRGEVFHSFQVSDVALKGTFVPVSDARLSVPTYLLCTG